MEFKHLQSINLEYIDIPKWIHPSVYISYSKIDNAGLGVFAKNDILPGTFLGEYLGEIVNECKNNNYAFSYEKNKLISALDINKSNYTRYINCSFDNNSENLYCINMKTDYMYNENKNLKNRKFFFARNLIKKDTELLYYYGDNYAKSLNITYRLDNNEIKKFNE